LRLRCRQATAVAQMIDQWLNIGPDGHAGNLE
jgi:hypothetical protein